MPARRSCPFRRPGSSHLGAAAAPSALAVHASLRAVSRQTRSAPRRDSTRPSWAREKLLPRGARRTPGQSARGSHEAQMASQMHHLAPSTTSPHPRDGDPARAKVGQVLTARPAALGPTGRAGARSSLQAGVGLRNAARPGRIALQRLGRPQPLGDLASNYASGLVSSLRGAASGDSRENLHRNRERVLPCAGTETPVTHRGAHRARLLRYPALGSPQPRASDSPQPLLPQRAAKPQTSSLPLTRLRKQSFAVA